MKESILKRPLIDSANKMLRVVMISPLPPERFGEAKYTTELITRLASRKWLDIIAVTGTEADSLGVNGREIETHRVWNHTSPLYPIRLLGLIRRLRPHLVHVQFGPYGRLFGGLFGEIMLILLILLRTVGIRTTVTLHSTWMPEQVQQRVQQYKKLRRLAFLAPTFFRLYMRLLDWGTTSIQLSTVRMDSRLKREFIRQYRISPRKVLEIPHAFDNVQSKLESEVAKNRLDIQHEHVLLMFGFIRRGKGLDVAINAMQQVSSRVSNVLLLVAGQAKDSDSKEYLVEIKERVKELGLEDHVRFDTRYIPDEDVPLYFSAATLVLMPYTESVGASGPIHNFAGLGVPIIASNVGLHMPETLDGNITLFRDGDSSDLARVIINLLEDTEARDQIGEMQSAYASKESWGLAAERTIANYYKTLQL